MNSQRIPMPWQTIGHSFWTLSTSSTVLPWQPGDPEKKKKQQPTNQDSSASVMLKLAIKSMNINFSDWNLDLVQLTEKAILYHQTHILKLVSHKGHFVRKIPDRYPSGDPFFLVCVIIMIIGKELSSVSGSEPAGLVFFRSGYASCETGLTPYSGIRHSILL
ncbi:hypothetical protein ElyMa_006351600 [Elysia marginata]|uniref:Reverse transcriptase domain-containing protein n=1 Tax=Elysia marginata TaxID=1093978 RepID=A0AAV4HMT7_9GAST|nr:hypothetical protein ElyMa_006351600 [Elysia marginata]